MKPPTPYGINSPLGALDRQGMLFQAGEWQRGCCTRTCTNQPYASRAREQRTFKWLRGLREKAKATAANANCNSREIELVRRTAVRRGPG